VFITVMVTVAAVVFMPRLDIESRTYTDVVADAFNRLATANVEPCQASIGDVRNSSRSSRAAAGRAKNEKSKSTTQTVIPPSAFSKGEMAYEDDRLLSPKPLDRPLDAEEPDDAIKDCYSLQGQTSDPWNDNHMQTCMMDKGLKFACEVSSGHFIRDPKCWRREPR